MNRKSSLPKDRGGPPLAYIVFVEDPFPGRCRCWRDSEHAVYDDAKLTAKALRVLHPGCFVWIEPAYVLPFAIDSRFYIEVPKPEESLVELGER